jgi:hypothetical protein
VTYDEALAALLGFMGKPVTVIIRSPGNPAVPGLAQFYGVLAAAEDMADAGREVGLDFTGQDWMHFHFQGRSLTEGFFVDRDRFIDAQWDEAEPVPRLDIHLVNEITVSINDESPDTG